ncbi:hypothetical protein MPH_04094 [Macrophomina phaseolina MS6]|uniref:DUF7223 domain-containing protein n=1 Tax=Macrophomina phaseolina (strain MS6) TaxID=1126212 RepID=K2R8A4_MACPH|nr:hypothetical protein MPH_04094 [Macrophomina phaseolina MS6]
MATTAFPQQSLVPSMPSVELGTALTVDLSRQIDSNEVTTMPAAPSNTATPAGLHPPSDLRVICNSCSTNGLLIARQGGWNVSGQDFESGWIDIALTNFSAHADLTIVGIEGAGSMSRVLGTEFPIPGAGFKLPGFGKAGLIVTPEIYLDWDFSDAAVTLSTGWDLIVPNGAHMLIDFADVGNSLVDGFSGFRLNMLPLASRQPNITSVNMSLSVGLRLSVSMGLESNIAGLSAEAGLYLDLPVFNATATGMLSTSYLSLCAAAGAHPGGELADAALANFTHTYGKIIEFGAAVGLNAGLEVGLALPLAGPIETALDLPILSQGVDTGCFVFDEGTNLLVNAVDQVEQIRRRLQAETQSNADDDQAGGEDKKQKGAATAVSPDMLVSVATGSVVLVALIFSFL